MGSIPENAILATANVTALHPSIPHDVGLKALREVLEGFIIPRLQNRATKPSYAL